MGVGVAVVAAVAAHAMDAPTRWIPSVTAAAFGSSTAAAMGLAITPTTVGAPQPRTIAPDTYSRTVHVTAVRKAATVTEAAPTVWTAVMEHVEVTPAVAARAVQRVAAAGVAAGAAAVVADAAAVAAAVANYAEAG
jgi:hypothetical protein